MENSALITIGLPVSLIIIMFGMGLSLAMVDFRRVAQTPKAVGVATVLQLFGVPALGFAIGWALVGAGGSAVLAVGLVLVAALPGGTTSNVLCYLAKANLALSITLTLLASILTIVTIPLYVNLALGWFAGDTANLSLPVAKTLITMLVIVVLPVGVGMLVKSRFSRFAAAAEPWISRFAVFVLVAIIVAIVATEWANLPAWIAAAWMPVLALNIGALALGLGVAKLAGLSTQDGLTTAIELGIKNSTLGLAVALSLLKNTELALPAAVYGLLMYASVAALAVYGRRVAARSPTHA